MATTETLEAGPLIERFGEHRVERDVVLAPLTTFRIGGPADLFLRVRTTAELADALLIAREIGMPHFLLGSGANILIGDGGFRGLVIHNLAGGIEFLDERRVRAG
ncbi:MAG: UDP-N-acetylmuramate dehydrogenase, partial [Longimicrobiales bacterium]